MKTTWYGTASLIFEDNRDCFAVDPFLKMLPDGAEPREKQANRQEAFLRCHKILLTHGHLDHMGSVQQLYGDGDAIIYATAGPAANLKKMGFDPNRIQVLAPGDTLQLGECQIVVHKGKHIQYDLPLLRKIGHRAFPKELHELNCLRHLNERFPEYGETVVYEIRYHGKQILILGSADLDANITYPTGADVLFLPHQGRSDMTAHNFHLLQKLRPKQVYLDHYDDSFPPLSEEVDCAPLMQLVHENMPDMTIEPLQEGTPIFIDGQPQSRQPHTPLISFPWWVFSKEEKER